MTTKECFKSCFKLKLHIRGSQLTRLLHHVVTFAFNSCVLLQMLKICHLCEKLWHMPQKHQAHATNSCGTCPVFLWHVSQFFRARAITFCGMRHNFSGNVPQLFGACATTFRGMCHNFSRHVSQLLGTCATTCGICHNLLRHMPYNLWHMPHSLWHVPHILWYVPHIGHCPSSPQDQFFAVTLR